MLYGCGSEKNKSYFGIYTDNSEKLELKEDLTYTIKEFESQNIVEGDYYIEDGILHMFSEYVRHEYAIENGNIYMIYKGDLSISDNYIEGDLICKDKSDMPAIYTYSFKNNGTVDIIFELGQIHNEGKGNYELNGDNIKIDTETILEKNGDCYYRLLYKKQ